MAKDGWIGDPETDPPPVPELPPQPPTERLIPVERGFDTPFEALHYHLGQIEAKLDQLLERMTVLEKYHEEMYNGQ